MNPGKLRSSLGIYWRHFRQLRRQPSFPIEHDGLIYHCPLNWRKRHNLAMQQINKSYLERCELAWPHILQVEVSSFCNLRCPACPTGTKSLGRPSQHLDVDVYRRMVDELRGSLLLMFFWNWGEPLLHPRIADMIAYAKRSDIKTVLSTNASLPFADEKLDRLVASKLDVLFLCADGATQATYEKYRRGGQLSMVLDFCRRLVRARQRQGTRYPLIEFRTLATRYNFSELPALLRLAEETGADLFNLKSLRPYDYHGHELDRELVPLHPDLARHAYEPGALPEAATRIIQQRGPLRCGAPMYAPALNSNNALAFCCHAQSEEEVFGDISRIGFQKVWRSGTARRQRLAFLQQEGTNTNSCKTCYFRSDHKPTIRYTVPLQPFPPDITPARPVSRDDFLQAVANSGRPAA